MIGKLCFGCQLQLGVFILVVMVLVGLLVGEFFWLAWEALVGVLVVVLGCCRAGSDGFGVDAGVCIWFVICICLRHYSYGLFIIV